MYVDTVHDQWTDLDLQIPLNKMLTLGFLEITSSNMNGLFPRVSAQIGYRRKSYAYLVMTNDILDNIDEFMDDVSYIDSYRDNLISFTDQHPGHPNEYMLASPSIIFKGDHIEDKNTLLLDVDDMIESFYESYHNAYSPVTLFHFMHISRAINKFISFAKSIDKDVRVNGIITIKVIINNNDDGDVLVMKKKHYRWENNEEIVSDIDPMYKIYKDLRIFKDREPENEVVKKILENLSLHNGKEVEQMITNNRDRYQFIKKIASGVLELMYRPFGLMYYAIKDKYEKEQYRGHSWSSFLPVTVIHRTSLKF